MSTVTILILFMVGTFVSDVRGQRNSLTKACKSWNDLDSHIHPIAIEQLNCTVNKQCTRVHCAGKYKGYKGQLQLILRPCSNPLSVQIKFSVPQLNIYDWNHTFVDGEQVVLPWAKSLSASGVEDDRVMVHLYRLDQFTVSFGLSITKRTDLGDDASVNIALIKNETLNLPSCSQNSPPELVQESAILGQAAAVPFNSGDVWKKDASVVSTGNGFQQVTNVADGKPCHMNLLNQCGENEICNQTSGHDTKGVCICLSRYLRNSDGICTIVPSSTDDTENDGPSTEPAPYPSMTQISIQIAVPIILIVLIAVLVVLAFRYRWITRLRARFRQVRVYEEMVIDSEEVASMTSQGLDPVA